MTDTEPPQRKHKLILHVELPDIWADDMTAEHCADSEYTPEEVFEEAFDDNVIVTLLAHVGETPDEMIARDGKVVGFEVVPR